MKRDSINGDLVRYRRLNRFRYGIAAGSYAQEYEGSDGRGFHWAPPEQSRLHIGNAAWVAQAFSRFR